MKILEYDQVDPMQALDVTMLALHFPMNTPGSDRQKDREDDREFLRKQGHGEGDACQCAIITFYFVIHAHSER